MKTLEASALVVQSLSIFYDWRCKYSDNYPSKKLRKKLESRVKDLDLYCQNLEKLVDLLRLDLSMNATGKDVVESLRSFKKSEWYLLEQVQDEVYSEYFYHYDFYKRFPEGLDLSLIKPEDLYLDDPENVLNGIKYFNDRKFSSLRL